MTLHPNIRLSADTFSHSEVVQLFRKPRVQHKLTCTFDVEMADETCPCSSDARPEKRQKLDEQSAAATATEDDTVTSSDDDIVCNHDEVQWLV